MQGERLSFMACFHYSARQVQRPNTHSLSVYHVAIALLTTARDSRMRELRSGVFYNLSCPALHGATHPKVRPIYCWYYGRPLNP